MTATDGQFNATCEVAQGQFAPSFPYGERHEIFVHAQGQDNQWCSFVKVIINPNVACTSATVAVMAGTLCQMDLFLPI
jgi:hypothetical protein